MVWSSDVSVLLIAAQAATVSIAGTVRDRDSGAPLSQATVTLVDRERTTLTDGEGRYFVLGVPAGPQRVVVRRLGYERRDFQALVPRDGTLEIDVVMRRTPIPLQPIEVRGAVPVPGLEYEVGPRFPDRGISIAAVREHPLLSEPDVFEALGGGEVTLRPESPSGFGIRGGASDQVAYLLDGIPILNPYHAAGTFSAWNPDALSRVDLVASSPSLAFPDALSGAVSGTTRAPGSRIQAQGSVGTTQSRVALDGPLGHAGAGYLLSLRSASPGLVAGKREPSHVRGEGGDWLAKLDLPWLGGRLGLLGYGSETEIDAAATEPAAGKIDGRARNAFSWESSSFGAGWTRSLRNVRFELRVWSAAGDAGATWEGRDSLSGERLAAERDDQGFVALVERDGTHRTTTAGVRARRERTSYRLESDANRGPSLRLDARSPVSAAFVEHQRRIAAHAEVAVSVVTAVAAGAVRLDPGARLVWTPSADLAVSCDCSRRHQYSQSLRNSESVVGNIFPADLPVGAGGQVPVARSDLAVVAVEHRPASGLRYGAQAYARSFESLLLVAPREAGPFTTSGFTTGDATAYGASLHLAANGPRFGVIADYGFQRVRVGYAQSSYVPDRGATQSIGAGVVVRPSSTSSIRLGLTSLFGRRTTAVEGAFEWEACNLLDQGCEFSGTPYGSGGLGEARLPAYCRVDLGVRKHWRLGLAGRDVRMAAFGTVTNLLGRKNVLTVAVDPSTGIRRSIDMRPRSPLVVGIDWSF